MDKYDFIKQDNKARKLSTKNKDVFEEDYLPDEILYRDYQIKKILQNIHGEHNSFLSGDISTGKTLVILALIKFLINRQNEELKISKNKDKPIKKNLYVYHYCKSSRLIDVYKTIGDSIGYSLQRNLSIKHHEMQIEKLMNKKNINKVYLCLDEIDLLINRIKVDNELLYYFSNEPRYCLILISNSTDFLNTLGARTMDRLQIEVISFEEYTSMQIIDILKQRVSLGIDNGIISDLEIQYIEKAIRESQNTLREGIKMISKIYDYKVLKEIYDPLGEQMIKYFINQVSNTSQIQSYKGLNINLKTTILIITDYLVTKKNKKSFTISDIVNWWDMKSVNSSSLIKRTYSSIRIYLNRLDTLSYIRKTSRGRSGQSGYEFTYYPLFNINEFNIYFERKQNFITKIEQDEASFNDLLKKLDPTFQNEPY